MLKAFIIVFVNIIYNQKNKMLVIAVYIQKDKYRKFIIETWWLLNN